MYHFYMAKKALPKWATTVTPFSKYLAMVLIILFPFIGFYLGLLVGEYHPSTVLPPAQLAVSPTVLPTLISTPTLAPGQKAIFTFYFQATAHKISNEELTLNASDTGKILTVDIGTLIIVNFGRVAKFQVSASSPQAIFTNFGRPETIHLPIN